MYIYLVSPLYMPMYIYLVSPLHRVCTLLLFYHYFLSVSCSPSFGENIDILANVEKGKIVNFLWVPIPEIAIFGHKFVLFLCLK